MRAALRAEALKLRRSAAARLPWVGLSIALLQGGLFMLSAQAVHTWKGITVWQTLWITFLLPLFLALLAGLTTQREQRAQGGGLWWRPVPWTVQGRAELVWLGGLSLLLNAAVVLPTLLFGLAAQLPGAWPLEQLLQMTLVLSLASLPLLALGQRCSRRFGLVAGLVLAFFGNLSGIMMSEGPWWFLNPWSWPIRATFTLSGTSANGLPLPPESPLWQISPWPIAALALLVTAALAAWPYALPRTGGAVRQRAGTLRDWRWTGPLAAEWVKYRHTALPWLTAVVPCLVALLTLLKADAHSVWQVWTLLALPFGAALMSALTWGWEAESWRMLSSRQPRPARLYAVKLVAMWLLSLLSGALLFILMALLGEALPMPGLLLALYTLVTAALLSFHLWAAVRYSPGVTLGVGIITTLLALILGGTGLGSGIWPFFPWVWARVVPFTPGVQAEPFLLALLAMTGLFAWLGAKDARSIFNDRG